jgi:TolB-like protein/tetratricopeptide (TPR) repeat protein
MTPSYCFGRFALRPLSRQLIADGTPVDLGSRAFDVLVALVEHRDRMVTKEELLELVWAGRIVEESNLHVQVSLLRKILGDQAIKTISGRGYRFTAEVFIEDATRAEPSARSLGASLFADKVARAPSPSIAVLPFFNLSTDPNDEYFADGLAEELLSVLSRLRGLRVASRTSAFYFKGKKLDLQTVAQKLSVSNLLEGSVRRSAGRVRVTVQLIEVVSDSHVWSETFDRDIGDIFAIQDDIAGRVATELRSRLLAPEMHPTDPVVYGEIEAAARGRGCDAGGYQLYLQGRFFAARVTKVDTQRAIDCFRRSLDHDPLAAQVWSALSRAYQDETLYAGHNVDDVYRQSRDAALRALALDPHSAEAHMSLGRIEASYDWDWNAATRSYQRAFELDPNNVLTLRAAAALALNFLRIDEAIGLIQRSIRLDPLNAGRYETLAVAYLVAGDTDSAEAAARMAIDLSPSAGFVHFRLGEVWLRKSRFAEAIAEVELEANAECRLKGEAIVYHAMGLTSRSHDALNALIACADQSFAFSIAEAHAWRKESDAAFQWLERAYRQRDADMPQLRRSLYLEHLHDDSRWSEIVARMHLS